MSGECLRGEPRQLYTSDQLHLTDSCTALISTVRLNSGHQRASLVWDRFAHSASLQTSCCFRPDWGTTISRNYTLTHRSTLHCHNLSHCCSCRNECSLLFHHHLNKAGKDELCKTSQKAGKRKKINWFFLHPHFLMFPFVLSEIKEEFSHFQVWIPCCLSKIQGKLQHMLPHDILSPQKSDLLENNQHRSKSCTWVLIYWKLKRKAIGSIEILASIKKEKAFLFKLQLVTALF